MDGSRRGNEGSRRPDDSFEEGQRNILGRRRSRSGSHRREGSRHHRKLDRSSRPSLLYDDKLEDRRYLRRRSHSPVVSSGRSRFERRPRSRSPSRPRNPRSRSRSSSYGSPRRHKRSQKRKRKSKKHKRRDRNSSSSASGSLSSNQRTGIVSNDDEEIDVRKNRGSPHSKDRIPSKHDQRKKSRKGKYREDSRNRDDTVGHFHAEKGTIIKDRFKVIRQVGLGTFGKVLECLDMRRSDPPINPEMTHHGGEMAFVAIKMVRKIKRYHEAALVEAQIIQKINRKAGRGLSHCVRLRDTFNFSGHYCLVFESLGPSLHDFLKKNNFRGFPMVCVQDFAVQLLEALDFLHAMKIIHTDLKIENILLVSDKTIDYQGQSVPDSNRLKLIDFGGSCYDDEKKSSVINTRQYRAPEVILGTGWSLPSDIWSMGCIFIELYQGELLFGTHDDLEHLALIERIVGVFPRWMIREAKHGKQRSLAEEAFNSEGYHRLDRVLPPDSFRYVRSSKPLERIIKHYDDQWFLELLLRMLVIDPAYRARAKDCLQLLARLGRDKFCVKL